jgi:thioredoxin reductase (NADPH)
VAFRQLLGAEQDIGELVMRALILRRMGFVQHGQAGVVVIGAGHSADTLRLRRFLTRNTYPHRLIDLDSQGDSTGLLGAIDLGLRDLPAVLMSGRPALRNPSNAELSDALGLTEHSDAAIVHDVAVIGAGPAGLAAAVYAASEGLKTIVVEGLAPGGQAGTSSKIENYLGFPTGISGYALAGRAQVQAQKFGARLLISRMAVGMKRADLVYEVGLDDGTAVRARSVVIATGARYRKLAVTDYDKFEGQGIHYAATPMEAQLCEHQDVLVVGGGNSAGQAAVYLSRAVRHVHMLIRGAGLSETMSDYLIRRIEHSSTITLHPGTEIVALDGDETLRRVTWRHRQSGALESGDISNVFVMIGASPNTEWLGGCVRSDDGGFICTGPEATGDATTPPLATTVAGIFAVGDVRAGSVKRVASGVGEGSVVVQAIHRYLATLDD